VHVSGAMHEVLCVSKPVVSLQLTSKRYAYIANTCAMRTHATLHRYCSRGCGRIFCAACSDRRLLVLDPLSAPGGIPANPRIPHRVCGRCYKEMLPSQAMLYCYLLKHMCTFIWLKLCALNSGVLLPISACTCEVTTIVSVAFCKFAMLACAWCLACIAHAQKQLVCCA
jgi:FYVE zinc finger